MSDRFGERLERLAGVLDVEAIEPDRLRGLARRRRRRRILGSAAAVIVLLVAVAVPLRSLAGLGGSAPAGRATDDPPVVSGIPDVATLTCTDGETTITPEVRPQSDGVHFDVMTDASPDAFVIFQAEEVARLIHDPGDGHRSRASWYYLFTSDHVLGAGFPPGSYVVQCGRFSTLSNRPDPTALVPFTVSDPEGLWHSDSLSCERRVHGEVDIIEGFQGTGDAATTIRTAVPGILGADLVRPAGYPEEEERRWRIERDGEVIGIVRVLVLPRGVTEGPLWLRYAACEGSGIGGDDVGRASIGAYDRPPNHG